jgi:hypothetical protein
LTPEIIFTILKTEKENTMKNNKRTVLNVTYPLHYLFDVKNLDETIEKIVKRPSEGSGGGLGVRDLDFYFKTTQAANNAMNRLHRANIKFGNKKIPLTFELQEFAK